MKIISIVRNFLAGLDAATGPECEDRERWARDPLSHPALESMNERALGDLPFRRGYRAIDTECPG